MPNASLETLCFRITRHCNLSCGFCRAGSTPATREYSDVERFKSFAAAAQNHLGLRHISISGGEPGMDPRLPDLVDHLVAAGLCVTVTTNGTSRVSEKLEKAFGVFPGRLRVRVSVDGDRRMHDAVRGVGTFAKASEEIAKLRGRAGWVGINTVVRPELRGQGAQMATLATELDVDEWALITPVPQGSARGMAWLNTQTFPSVLEFRSEIQAAGYTRKVLVWNFIDTPNTSVLVHSNGDIVLAGVQDTDDVLLGKTSDFCVEALREKIGGVTNRASKSHFSWRGWE